MLIMDDKKPTAGLPAGFLSTTSVPNEMTLAGYLEQRLTSRGSVLHTPVTSQAKKYPIDISDNTPPGNGRVCLPF